MYKCECGREFEKLGSYRSHRRFCDLHEHHKEYVSKSIYKISENLYRCECGREFNNHQALNGHFTRCQIHRNSIGKPNYIPNSGKEWSSYIKQKIENIPDERKQEFHKKSGETYKRKIKSGEIIPTWKGKHHSEETKEKLRKIVAARNKEKYGKVVTNFSKKACEYIDNLNKEKGWNLQHAMNGGEKIIHGYYLDGYDEKLNIAFEYDEPFHYTDKENNILRKKDQVRQFIIVNTLNCKMYRYNEYTNNLYEVTNICLPEYEHIEDLINSGNLDFSSRKNLKESLQKYGYSYKLYDIFVEKHPELNLVNYKINSKKIRKIRSKEEFLELMKYKRQKEEKKIEREKIIYEGHLRYLESKEKREKLLFNIKKVINNIDLNSWGKISRLKKELKSSFNLDVTSKQIQSCLKSNKEFDLLSILFGKNEKYEKQNWVTNLETKEIKRIKFIELDHYLNNGWISGRNIHAHSISN